MPEDTRVPEAPLAETPHGLVPDGDGWFIVSFAEAQAMHTERFGDACSFESKHRPFPQFGINVHVLQPGQPNCLYHRESAQEAFLVLRGECIAIIEEQERPMRTGDFLYAPPGTTHVFVGAGQGPCAILMVGAREPSEQLLYPVSELAARHGASVESETDDARVAYAEMRPPEPTTLPLPW